MSSTTSSIWSQTEVAPAREPLHGNVNVDVAVIGGGISGITSALLLRRAGQSVAVVEARRVGHGESGKTTGHLTDALDTRYDALIGRFGIEAARLTAEGQRAAIDRIERFVDELGLACDFRRVPGFLYGERAEERDEIGREAAAVARLGIAAAPTDTVPLPFPIASALRFENQAAFHPRRYLEGLAAAFEAAGGRIFEETEALEVDDGEPCRVTTDHGTVLAREVIIASHVPMSNRYLLHLKLAASRTYVLTVEMPFDTDALFWDTARPYHYLRLYRGGGPLRLIAGGEDHQVGEIEDSAIPFGRLEDYVRTRFDRAPTATDHHWSGQIIASADGLPYVGRNLGSGHVFVATGYAGNGLTNGTWAALVLADQVRGQPSRWSELLDAARIKPPGAAKTTIEDAAPELPVAGPTGDSPAGPASAPAASGAPLAG